MGLFTFPSIIPLIMKSVCLFIYFWGKLLSSLQNGDEKNKPLLFKTYKLHNPTTSKHPGGLVVTYKMATTWNNDTLLEGDVRGKCKSDSIAAGQSDQTHGCMVDLVEDGDDYFLTNQVQVLKQDCNRGSVTPPRTLLKEVILNTYLEKLFI